MTLPSEISKKNFPVLAASVWSRSSPSNLILYADRGSHPIFQLQTNFLGSTPPIVFALRDTENLGLNCPLTVYLHLFKNRFTPNFNDVDLQCADSGGILAKIGNFEVSGQGIGKYCHRNRNLAWQMGPWVILIPACGSFLSVIKMQTREVSNKQA